MPGLEQAPTQFSANQAVRGGVWTLFGFGGVVVLRFGSSLIMTRLLTEGDFGVMSIVWSVLMGLHLLSDLGIATNIVQNARGTEPAFRNTAWTIAILRGFGIAAIALSCGPWIGAAYPDYPGLGVLIQATGINSILLGLGSLSLDVMNRNMAVGRLLLLELGTQVLSTGAMIVWAIYSPTPWAMIGGSIVGAAFKTLTGHLLFGGDRLHWDWPAAREIFRFGKWVFVSTALMFFVGQADRLIFGKLIPDVVLGVYSLAMQLAMLVPDMVQRLNGSIVFPACCRAVQLGEPLGPTYVRLRRPVLLLGAWSLSGICGGGDAAMNLLYESGFASAGWILQCLAGSVWFGSVMHGTHSSALIAMGQPRLVSYTSFAKLLGMLVLIPAGFHFAGFPGALVSYALSDLLRYTTVAWAVRSVGLPGIDYDLRLSAWFVVSAGAAWGTVRWLAAEGASSFVQCLAVFLVVSVMWVPPVLPIWRELRSLLFRRT